MPNLTGHAAEHPCFSPSAHVRSGRIHLPVAPRCNLQCAYCDRRYDCPNESRPGVASSLITPEAAVERTAQALKMAPHIRVAGVAGPGEPLENPETFETLERLHRQFPDLLLCVSTNGLLLPQFLDTLLSCGVVTLTITINAVTVETAANLYNTVRWKGTVLSREAGASLLLGQQRRGLTLAAAAGLTVKVNMVLVPGVNDREPPAVARMAAEAGAALMNLTPLIPCGRLSGVRPPTTEELSHARSQAAQYLPQFTHCRQCRADACGIPGCEPAECAEASG